MATTTNPSATARAPTRHQRTRRADPASLLSLFNTHAKGSTVSGSTGDEDDDATKTMKGYFAPQQKAPSWSSTNTLVPMSRGAPAPEQRWSVWTNDSTLHPGLEHDEEEDIMQAHPNMGIHMGIAMPPTHNGDHRSSIASSSSSNASHQSSIPSSALSPYTPSSVDSQPDPRRCPSPHCKADDASDDEGDDECESTIETQEANAAIDAALSSTMKALEAANSLLISTMSSRNNLTRLRAAQDALDDVMSERERELLRQIESNRQMADHMDRVCAELAEMAHSFPSPSPATPRLSSASRPAWNPASTSSITAEARVSKDSTRLGGIVEALDENATVGKTAAKRLERMLKASAGGSGDAVSEGSASVAAPPLKRNPSDARTLLSSLAAATSASPTSTSTAGVASRRSSSQSIPSKADVPQTARSASSPSDIRHRTMPSAPVLGLSNGAYARPELTRGRSSLSQAFGMDGQVSSDGTEDTTDEPVTPAQRTTDLPSIDDISSSLSSTATSAAYTKLTPYTTPTPSLLMHTRKMSHHHSPSVIKPSTASSALLSPEMSEWDRWRTDNPQESTSPDSTAGLPTRGQGALAALKMLSAQNKTDSPAAVPTPTSAPKRAASSPRLRNDAKLSTSPEAVPPLPTIQQRARSSSTVQREQEGSTQTQTAPQNNRSWSLSGWMKFGAAAGSGAEPTTTTATMPTSSSSSSIVEHAAV